MGNVFSNAKPVSKGPLGDVEILDQKPPTADQKGGEQPNKHDLQKHDHPKHEHPTHEHPKHDHHHKAECKF